jgi:hypothetical protein
VYSNFSLVKNELAELGRDFTGQAAGGFLESVYVPNPWIPAPYVPSPDTPAGIYGRIAGRFLAVVGGALEIWAGIGGVEAGAGMTASGAATIMVSPVSGGGLALPGALLTGGGVVVVVGGALAMGHGGITIINAGTLPLPNGPRPPNPAAFDPYVGTGSPSGFGKLIKWGSGAKDATARAESITLEEIQAAGITRPVADYWFNFYQNAMGKNRGALAAEERLKLMQRVIELLGGP